MVESKVFPWVERWIAWAGMEPVNVLLSSLDLFLLLGEIVRKLDLFNDSILLDTE